MGAFGEDTKDTHTDTSMRFAPLVFSRIYNKSYHHSGLFSLADVKKEPGEYSARIAPLYSYERTQKNGRVETCQYLLWPLMTRKSVTYTRDQRTRKRFNIFPFLWWKKNSSRYGYYRSLTVFPFLYTKNEGAGRKSLIIFPIYYSGKNVSAFIPLLSTGRQSFFSVFPFYGRFNGLWGRDQVRFYMWPLLTISRDDDLESIHAPWPFVGFYRGEGGGGFKLWPLFGYLGKTDGSRKGYLLWPLGHYRRRIDPETGEVKKLVRLFLPFYMHVESSRYHLRYYFPVYGEEKTPKRVSKSYVFPLYGTTRFKKTGGHEKRMLAGLARWRTGGTREIRELFPLFKTDTTPERTRSYFPYPFCTHKVDRDKNQEFVRTYLFPFLIYKHKKWKNSEQDEKRCVVLPFCGYRREKDGSTLFRALWPFWYTRARPIERLFAPLWTLYEARTFPDGTKKISAFWHIYTYKRTPEHTQWSVNPLVFSITSSDEMTKFSILGGLLGYREDEEKKKLSLLYIPIPL